MLDPLETKQEIPSPDTSDRKRPFEPTWLQRLGLFAVGASHEAHYTNRDVRTITSPALVTAFVAPFMGLGAGLLVTMVCGLAAPFALGVGIGGGLIWSGMMAVMDRAFIGGEAREKAIDAAKAKLYGDKPHRLSSFGMLLKRLPVLALRIALAGATSFAVSETIATTVIYKPDVEKVLDHRFKAANKDLIQYYDGLRAGYDAKTDQLGDELTAQKQRLVQQGDSYRIADVPVAFDSSAYQIKIRGLNDQEEGLQTQLMQAQGVQSQFQAQAQAEEVGARIGKGSTGHAGKGAAYNAAMIQFQQAAQSVATITAQIATINSSIETIRQDMTEAEQAQQAEFQVKTQNLDQNVQALTAQIKQLTQQVHDQQANRDHQFQVYDQSMEHDPRFVPHEHGLINSLSARDELLRMPENQGSPFYMTIAIWVVLGMMETLPYLSAKIRPVTRSELRSAVDDLVSEMKMTAELSDVKTALHVRLTENGLMSATTDAMEEQAEPKAPSGAAMKKVDETRDDFLVDSNNRQAQRLQHVLN
jgi:hypothetical protein